MDTTAWHSETPPLPQSHSSIPHSKSSLENALRFQLLPTVKVYEYRRLVSLLSPTLCFVPFVLCSTSTPLLIFSLFLSPPGFQPFPPVPAIPSPCTTLTLTKSDLTNLSHQPGNLILPQPTAKVVLASLLTWPLPTLVAQKTLLGMAMVAEMLHDARAAAEAPREGKRNEAGTCDDYFPGPAHLYFGPSRGSSPASQNPGNNLHVSGLSHRVDSRELENHFAAIGRVSHSPPVRRPATNPTDRFRRLKSCATPTPMSRVDSVSLPWRVQQRLMPQLLL